MLAQATRLGENLMTERGLIAMVSARRLAGPNVTPVNCDDYGSNVNLDPITLNGVRCEGVISTVRPDTWQPPFSEMGSWQGSIRAPPVRF